jgi:hypothetical protein
LLNDETSNCFRSKFFGASQQTISFLTKKKLPNFVKIHYKLISTGDSKNFAERQVSDAETVLLHAVK